MNNLSQYNLELKNVTKVFESSFGGKEVVAVNNVNIQIKKGELVTLLGPSGCGKTTTLRMIAGFEDASSGDILIDGELTNNIPPNKRDTGMVFQSYALFPHMNIFKNVSYGLELKGLARKEIEERANRILELVGLKGLGGRPVTQLSGGQQQRVALARAIVNEPKILLFDEPLSNLDAKLRVQMRSEIKKLQKTLKITSVYVTHDQEEAMSISDRIVVMNGGIIEQVGTAEEIYARPRNKFVADFIGQANFLPGKVVNKVSESLLVDVWGKEYEFNGFKEFSPGDNVKLVARPEMINIAKARQEKGFAGEVILVTYLGSEVIYDVDVKGEILTIKVSNPLKYGLCQPGDQVYIQLEIENICLIKGVDSIG